MYLILAPHPDDEIIGNFELIRDYSPEIMVIWFKDYLGNDEYIRRVRMSEAYRVAERYDFEYEWYDNVVEFIQDAEKFAYDFDYILVPDIKDGHEHHRLVNSAGYIVFKRYGLRFVEYTTRMNTEYVRGCRYPEEKLKALKMYESQSWLWNSGDARWWMFEGRKAYF